MFLLVRLMLFSLRACVWPLLLSCLVLFFFVVPVRVELHDEEIVRVYDFFLEFLTVQDLDETSRRIQTCVDILQTDEEEKRKEKRREREQRERRREKGRREEEEIPLHLGAGERKEKEVRAVEAEG